MKRLLLGLFLLPLIGVAVGCDDKKTSPPVAAPSGAAPLKSGDLPAPPVMPPKP